jgi:hypothetical protein
VWESIPCAFDLPLPFDPLCSLTCREWAPLEYRAIILIVGPGVSQLGVN